jgi:DNA-binding transcriptional ArsR family regulator
MARAATTTDIYNAIAEPRRRQIIELLSEDNAQPRSVNELVERMRLPQPAVSKHLGVLRKVGVVTVTKQGQHRLYQLNPEQLKTVHDWVKAFERFWAHQVDRIKQRAEQKAAERLARDN